MQQVLAVQVWQQQAHHVIPARLLTEEHQVMFQQTDRQQVQHLQQGLRPPEETILLHIPDLPLKDLLIPGLQTAMSEQRSQEPPVPTDQVQEHSLHIAGHQAVLQAGPIQVLQVKVLLQDLRQHLHIQGQVQQAGQAATRAQAAQAPAEVIHVRAARVQEGVIPVRAGQVQAEVILHQAAQAVPVPAEAIQADHGQAVVQVVRAAQVDPTVQADQGQAAAEDNLKNMQNYL